jgi:transposase
MSEEQHQLESKSESSDALVVTPFSEETVTLTKQEYIQLISERNRYKSLHALAVQRGLWYQERWRALLLYGKEQSSKRELELTAELVKAHAKIRDLNQRVFGRHCERGKGRNEAKKTCAVKRSRGHQKGAKNHGRSMVTGLPVVHETIALDNPICPQCGLPLRSMPGTEDSEVVEVEVKAFVRKIHRKRYTGQCGCEACSTIVCAPPAPKIIPKGKFGISVWSTVLLDKYLHGHPSERLLQDLSNHGLEMAPGTLAGGLHKIALLFEPIDKALLQKLRSQTHWHADETRWAMFVEIEGKVGYRWYLWVFHSKEVVHYVLDQTRATQVVIDEFEEVQGGIISCDRYSSYQSFVRQTEGFTLAFCWAHQRRDFLELANAYPEHLKWAFDWVDAIGQLYHLNALRLQTEEDSAERVSTQSNLELAVQRMADQRDVLLATPKLAEPCQKVLTSMKKHWSGLIVFVSYPWVPMDNNTAERDMRGPVIGRKNFYGSGALWAGTLAATMYSLLATLKLYGINPMTWMMAYLQACANNGAKALSDLSSFLPWSMDETRLAAMRSHVPIESVTLQSAIVSTAAPTCMPVQNSELEIELDST